MSNYARITTEEVETYLDQRMNVVDRAKFEQRLSKDIQAQQLLKQMSATDESLRRQFLPPDVSTGMVEAWLEESMNEPVAKLSGRSKLAVAATMVLAASIALFVYLNRPMNSQVQPFFETRALAAIYQETVDDGFRPYYFCEDLDRFAATFEKRQGVRLTLTEMPANRRMVGLSYVGGLTRNTTAMLCRVEEQPVMVFVDKHAAETNAELAIPDGVKLFVHQSQLADLVLYEVSPFEQAKMMDFLTIALMQ